MNVADYISRIDRDDISIHLPYVDFSDKDKCILLISHELSRTGAPLQMLELSSALLRLGYQPFVYSLSEGDLIGDYMDMGVPVISGIGPAENAEWLTELASLSDIIFVNTLLLAEYIRFLTSLNKQLFWWIHESTYLFKDKYCIDIPETPLLTILAASDKTSDHIARYLKRNAKVLNVCAEDYGISEKRCGYKTVFLWAGFLDFNKAPEVLLEAITNLSSDYMSRAEFFIFGQSRRKNEYSEMVERFTSGFSNIHFMNAVDHNEFMHVMDEVDAVIVSSLEETTSMVAVEGLMMGKTVICSDGCGVTQHITDGKNGFVFHVRDHKMLAEKMKYIIDHYAELDDLKLSGRNVYEKYYSFDVFEKNLAELLA